ncbi:hypothetical protein FRC11_005812 [Ceratobasidium sp. 423]|nr:hypothetical protein FRC11_005812 [Ceratobasidium sp. 423]
MSHPPFWIDKQFFYPIGNTPAISLTQDLSPEQPTADILLLGCGDPRNILFTLYSDLTVGKDARKLDITCCDIQPAVLARNILLFLLLDENEIIDRVWDIFFHFKIDDRASKIITQQSQALYERAETVESWRGSRFGSFLKMADTRTLAELRCYWKNYADFVHLPSDRKNRIIKEQTRLSKSVLENYPIPLSPSRSAGMLWPQAIAPVANLFRKYWQSGTTFTLASNIKSATNLNPTFVYSLSGEGFDPHYGTFPSGFHLITAYAPIKSDPARPIPMTGSAEINTSKQQFSAWCTAFRDARKTNSITIRFFSGEAIALCRALGQFKATGNPTTNIFVSAFRAAQINLDELALSDPPAPIMFDVIDTSNLTDHLGLFNLLLVTHSLLKEKPQSQAVLHTETLISSGPDATTSFLIRLFTDVPTITALFGIAPRPYVSKVITHSNAHELLFHEEQGQYHERVAWSDPSRGDGRFRDHQSKTSSFEPVSLAQILYGIYDNMFSNEKTTAMRSALLAAYDGQYLPADVHYQRETVALLFRAARNRVHLCTGHWEQVADIFIQMCMRDKSRLTESNCYQDLCLQLHLYGIYSVDTLKPNWTTSFHGRLRASPRNTLFNNWSNLPPVVCVVLTVPRQRLKPFSGEPGKVGCPTFQGGLRVPGSHDNIFAAIHLVWGKCITLTNSARVVIEEDSKGKKGQSDLVVSFWASTRILEIPGTQIDLRLKSNPQASIDFTDRLGAYLQVFVTDVTDKKHVRVLTYRPTLASESSQNLPLVHSLRPKNIPPDELCHGIITNPQTQQVGSLSIRFSVKNTGEQKSLENGASVSVNQVSACTIELTIGTHSHLLSYPYPVHGKNHKLKVARKSHYVEVVVPVSTPDDYSGYFFNPFPVISPNGYMTWNIHHIHLDRLPILDVRFPPKVDWLSTLSAHQLSERENDVWTGDEVRKHAAVNALVNVKGSIHAITMKFSGIRGYRTRTIGLCEKSQGGIYVLLLIGNIRLDLASSTIVLDTAVIPLSNDRLDALSPGIQDIVDSKTLLQGNTVGHEVEAWKRLIPAFVERCRNWSHLPNCEYKSQGRVPLSTVYDENPICSCGQGIGFTSTEWNVPEWKHLLPFATRAAICPIFPVSYLERVAGHHSEPREATMNKPVAVCWACGGPGNPTLSACSRCQKARYCSVACQKRDWKAHKGYCKAT